MHIRAPNNKKLVHESRLKSHGSRTSFFYYQKFVVPPWFERAAGFARRPLLVHCYNGHTRRGLLALRRSSRSEGVMSSLLLAVHILLETMKKAMLYYLHARNHCQFHTLVRNHRHIRRIRIIIGARDPLSK